MSGVRGAGAGSCFWYSGVGRRVIIGWVRVGVDGAASSVFPELRSLFFSFDRFQLDPSGDGRSGDELSSPSDARSLCFIFENAEPPPLVSGGIGALSSSVPRNIFIKPLGLGLTVSKDPCGVWPGVWISLCWLSCSVERNLFLKFESRPPIVSSCGRAGR